MLEVKKIIVATAGPVMNLIIAGIFANLDIVPNIKQQIVFANLLIAIFNLMPIYPLDGGRILKGILYIIFGKWKARKYINEISIIFTIFITAIASIGIYYFKNIAIFIIVIYLWGIVINGNLKYMRQVNTYNVIKTIENK